MEATDILDHLRTPEQDAIEIAIDTPGLDLHDVTFLVYDADSDAEARARVAEFIAALVNEFGEK